MSKNRCATRFYRKDSKLKTQKEYISILVVWISKHIMQHIKSSLTKGELLEQLEQLRWLENNYAIHCVFIKKI